MQVKIYSAIEISKKYFSHYLINKMNSWEHAVICLMYWLRTEQWYAEGIADAA